jgi:hypothetical protein
LSDEDTAFVADDASFLAALYRLLPESRRGLERGLTLELRAVEADMARLARTFRTEPGEDMTVMAAALLRAGVELPTFTPATDDRSIANRNFDERSTAEQLTGMVLVAGRRGLRVPLELVLRVVGREGLSSIIETTKQFDIIRWSDDESGDQFLGARTALEAELIARSDFRDARAEVSVLESMLRHIKPESVGSGGAEVQFAVDVLSRIGPDSPDGGRFKRSYPALANALAEARSVHSHAHPRLMLAEANLRREFVRTASSQGWASKPERLELLAEARDVLEAALEQVQPSLLRLSLLTELASTLGSELYERAGDDEDAALGALTDQIVSLANQARALDPENFYPVDVIAWVSLRVAQKNAFDAEQLVALMADTLAAFASIDPTVLSPKQRAQYDSRLAQVGELLRNEALTDEHLEELRANDDPAACFLLALHESRTLFGEVTPESAARGLRTLMDAPDTVRQDWRCARLVLDLFWISRTGKRFLQGEREALAFDDAAWNECLDLIEQVRPATADSYRVQFLRGLALFHLRQYRVSFEVFRELDRSAVTLSRRVIATYVLSDSTGQAVRFTGQVRSVTPDYRRGYVWIDELGIELTFIPYRFAREGLERGDQLPEFYIAFNFRGPYADPVRTARPTVRARAR